MGETKGGLWAFPPCLLWLTDFLWREDINLKELRELQHWPLRRELDPVHESYIWLNSRW